MKLPEGECEILVSPSTSSVQILLAERIMIDRSFFSMNISTYFLCIYNIYVCMYMCMHIYIFTQMKSMFMYNLFHFPCKVIF